MIDVCLHGMANEIFLEYLTFPSFSRLMEASRRTNESVRRAARSSRAYQIVLTRQSDHFPERGQYWLQLRRVKK